MSDYTRFDVQKVGYELQIKPGSEICTKASYEDGCIEVGTANKYMAGFYVGSRNSSHLARAMSYVNGDIKNKLNNNKKRKDILFIITDGMANFNKDNIGRCYEKNTGNYRSSVDQHSDGPLGDCVGPIDIEMCERIKSGGVGIAIVYTRYRDRLKEGDKEFENIVLPQLGLVEDHLKKCASPGLFEVSDFSGNMYEKIRSVFEKASMNLKLVH
ncbi:hypothetical protein [Ochrobactrum sp. Marseille-Q0166]|uniref:hypothetical protein n=1 Tax=Ochrobactrum sp. Marseille-Q0166 TaxID=2761105 RepID=UPI001655BB03|nr:hypothetical protein [Ochrobactrum sp. Marseille-Q0166]MBC8719090.1 hypothetical protein [Ochrobactrum sp. Marseille-Q0166]